jgi:two-component system alkaline phosphatase synthesis response regulator PhoP
VPRMGDSDTNLLRVVGVELDVVARVVEVHGETHHLTPKQCALLACLMRNPGRTMSREEIRGGLWETDYLGDTRTIEVHISWLRSKIEPDRNQWQFIHTVRTVGYRFVDPDAVEGS